MTWLEELLGEISAVDLSKPASGIKTLDEAGGDVVIGELSEHLQKVHRLRQEPIDALEELLQKAEEAQSLHREAHLSGDGSHNCEEHRKLMERYKEESAPHLHRYVSLDFVWTMELAKAFPDQTQQHEILGVRNGTILVGREDNKRGDMNILDKMHSRKSGGVSMEVHIIAMGIGPDDDEDETPTPSGEPAAAGAGAN